MFSRFSGCWQMRTNASSKRLFLVYAVNLWLFGCWSCLCLTKLLLLLFAAVVFLPRMTLLASHRLCLFLSGPHGSQKACCPGWACPWSTSVRLTARLAPDFTRSLCCFTEHEISPVPTTRGIPVLNGGGILTNTLCLCSFCFP